LYTCGRNNIKEVKKMEKILLKNAEIVDDVSMRKADILIEAEKIAGVEDQGYFRNLEKDPDLKIIDLTGKFVFPGIIDAHTHYALHSRGTVTADDFFSGSTAAAAGGVTSIIDYIDFPEDGDFKKAFAERRKEAEDSVIDYNFHQVIQDFDENISNNLADLKEIGLASIKLFTTYKRAGYMIDRSLWGKVLKRLKELKLLATVHAEDDALIQELEAAYKKRELLDPAHHPFIRPDAAEALAVKDIGEEALKYDIPLYIVHLSSALALNEVRRLRKLDADIYLETTPHYLMLNQAKLHRKDAQLYFMTPPLRTEFDNKHLWAAFNIYNEFQVIATDHCAFNKEQKFQSNSSLDILPGIPGSETLLPLIYTYGVSRGKMRLTEMVEMLSVNPAKIFGLYPEKGSFKINTDADLTVLDPSLEKKLTAENLHSAADYSPYKEFKSKGYPVMTIRRGEIIFENNLKAKKGSGKFIHAHSSDLFLD
jgi:dihydropyrimidinase